MTEPEIKAAVRKRDGHRCVDCSAVQEGHPRQFHVHRCTPGSEYTVDDCVTLCPSCHRKRHPKHHQPKELVRLPGQLVYDARLVASAFGESLGQYVTRLLRDAIRQDGPKVLALIQQRFQKLE